MDNVSYHGTSTSNLEEILSKLDINVGKGELGKGFYTGTSVALAAIWAQNRYKNNGVVIEFNIPLASFVKLKGRIIKSQSEVVDGWRKLKDSREDNTFVYGFDYVAAPFAVIEHTGSQFKFESQKAEDELNASIKTVYPCGS